MCDTVITIINVILVIISGFGAWKSIQYFKKTKELTIYTQDADVIDEVNEMLSILLKALEIANQKVKKRDRGGKNFDRGLLNCGKELIGHYQEIERNIPSRYHNNLNEILNKDGFEFIMYLNSLSLAEQ